MRRNLAPVVLKQTAVTYTFFRDWVYLSQGKLKVDANHPIILLDKHSAYMKLEAAANVASPFSNPHYTSHEI
jgi:hypothetical protein